MIAYIRDRQLSKTTDQNFYYRGRFNELL